MNARCTGCGEEGRERYPGLTRCIDCERKRVRDWAQANPAKKREINRRSKLKYLYNLTVEEWDAMLEAQGGCCAICGTDTPGGGGTFHTDHDQSCCPGRRSCGKCVRGLLCAPCNTMVRQVERMRAAVEYLESYNKR